jgi:hypothetical protein
MTTKPKTRKASKMQEMATLDFEPWKDNQDEALRTFNFEAINNPYLVSCRLACVIMGKSKPEPIEMIKEDDGDITLQMLDRLNDSSKFFKGVAELIEAARARLIVAGASYTEAP